MDCSPPGSSVHGILQTRILEWVAISSPGDLPNPGVEPRLPSLQADSYRLSQLHISPPWMLCVRVTASTRPYSPYRSAQNQRLLGGWEAVSLEAERQSQGAGWHRAHMIHSGWGCFPSGTHGAQPWPPAKPKGDEAHPFPARFQRREESRQRAAASSAWAHITARVLTGCTRGQAARSP